MISKIFVALIAIQHIGFLILEMFFWNKPLGHKIFKLDPIFAEQSAVLGANQGLYNGFLALGLLWSTIHPDKNFGFQLQTFFLLCVIAAGLYGGYSASKNIYFVQALPAGIALGIVLFTMKG